MSKLPIGIRQNNPGNIVAIKGVTWEGQSPYQEGRFVIFSEPKWGIRAICRVLITYADARRAKDGSRIDTISEVIERWAPPVENDTDAYARHVAKRLSVGPDEILDIKAPATMKELVKAIIAHENGAAYADYYDEATIDAGMTLAGIVPERKPLSRDAQIVGSQVALGAGGLTAVLTEVQAQVAPLVPYAEALKWVLIGAALIGLGITVWSTIRKRRLGVA